MGNSPPMRTGMWIPRNLLNGDGFGDKGEDGEQGRGWYTRPVAIPTNWSNKTTYIYIYIYFEN
ncbi:hypothetical protein GBA52_002994 [Prunus armeniaca]|nr:hypothetical protein GBA52_002994 [Prunus armeniaca]